MNNRLLTDFQNAQNLRSTLPVVRWVSLGVLFLVFTVIAVLAVTDGATRGGVNAVAGVSAVITGPFVGAVARGFQSCCLEFSLRIAWYCVPALLLGILLQWMPSRHGKWMFLKLSAWVIGWIAWFGGGVLSYLHAFN